MINPSELRIGNIVLLNGMPTEVQGVAPNGILLNGYQNGDSIDPFPLNDFILEQLLGKNRINNHLVFNYFKNSTYFVAYEETRDAFGNIIENRTGYYVGMYDGPKLIHLTPCSIHYLHQLQNIHFAQFGNELGLTMNKVMRVWNTAKSLSRI